MEQELGDAWISGVPPSDMRRCLDTYVSAFQTEQPFTMEYRLRRADGQYRWVLDTGIPLFEADGTFAGFIGSCMDLVERKEMEDQLRKALKEKENLLREVPHRVKNNLQVLASLLNRQSASIKDPQDETSTLRVSNDGTGRRRMGFCGTRTRWDSNWSDCWRKSWKGPSHCNAARKPRGRSGFGRSIIKNDCEEV